MAVARSKSLLRQPESRTHNITTCPPTSKMRQDALKGNAKDIILASRPAWRSWTCCTRTRQLLKQQCNTQGPACFRLNPHRATQVEILLTRTPRCQGFADC